MVDMRRLLSVVLLVSVLAFVGVAVAMDQPTVTTPKSGDTLGPNYDIAGSMPYRALIVVITECLRPDTGAVVGSVPGIRHWTTSNGSFQFRCASPRVFLGEGVPLSYRIRCFEVDRSGAKGPETVVNCNKAK
jgi:hypothetical protein